MREALTASDLAVARSHAYMLFSRLFLAGLTPDLLPVLIDIPALFEHIPQPYEADQAAADYHGLFSLEVFPYASVFLDSFGLMGGPVSEQVAVTYDAAGWKPAAHTGQADHIGHELGFLAYLSAREAQALSVDRVVAARLHGQQVRFCREQLLTWIWPLAESVRRHGSSFFRALMELTCQVVGDHVAQEGEQRWLWALPEPPPLLDSPGTGLQEIAAYLLCPAVSGFYLGQADLRRLGRVCGLAGGFGQRRQLLTNLMRSAAVHERYSNLVQELVLLAESWRQAYIAQGGRHPAAAPHISVWQRRISATRDLLERLRDLAVDQSDQVASDAWTDTDGQHG